MKHFSFLILLLPLLSCASNISGVLAADSSAVLTVSASLQPQMASLVQRLSAAGGQSGGTVLDGAAISRSMTEAPGVASASLRNTSPASVEGPVLISALGEFLAASGSIEAAGGQRFIIFERNASGTGGRCLLNISRENGTVIIGLLSPQINDFLNALMAPIATGESMTKPEYLDLIAVFYSRALSEEIASSRIRASIDFPAPVTNVRTGASSGRRVNFDVSLLDLLVLESPLVHEVTWEQTNAPR